MASQKSYSADWILPVVSKPICQGVLTTDNGRIVSVLPGSNRDSETRLPPNTILMPGLVNAHTHLEFSDLQTPLGRAGMPFPSWIAEVIRNRNSRQGDSDALAKGRTRIQMGLAESHDAGVALIGEIVTSPWDVSAYQQDQVAVLPFFEQLGLNVDQADERAEQIKAACRNACGHTLGRGLSPHASYSVGPKLFKNMLDYARKWAYPVAMHLSESKEEIEFLENGKGPFAGLFTEMGVWNQGTAVLSIGQCLEELGRCAKSLLIHGNYLSTDQISLISRYQNLSVVFCPRTHAYFGHQPYPLPDFIEANVNVALGTDSRASNPDLDLLMEMRFLAKTFSGIEPSQIIKMGTINGANALGLGDQFGTLEPMKNAKVLAIEMAGPIGNDPFESLLKLPIQRRYWLST